MSDITEVVDEASANLVEYLMTADEFTSKLLVNRFGFFVLGASAGAATAYFVTKRFLETKYSKLAEDEISSMREHYSAKARALESEKTKRPVEDIVKERGYSSPEEKTTNPPMAVQPPTPVLTNEPVEGTADDSEMAEDDVEGPNGVKPRIKNIFREAQVTHEWDYHRELKKRSPDVPYVIHYDEKDEMDGYSEATLTYYEGDDVLCDHRDDIIGRDDGERDRLVGEGNLARFGHGSNDAAIVFVRNDELEMVYEIVKSPNHYAEEVHGFKHHGYDSGNLERMRNRERNAQDDE